MKLSKLKPAKRNPRKITDDALRKLADSIERDPQFMKLRPIVYDAAGVIIGGNQRYRAIKEILGKSEIPDSWAIEAKDLTPEQARRFQLVDNAPEGMAGAWDIDLLEADWDLPELADLGFDLAMFELINDKPASSGKSFDGFDEIGFGDDQKKKGTFTYMEADREAVKEKLLEIEGMVNGFRVYF